MMVLLQHSLTVLIVEPKTNYVNIHTLDKLVLRAIRKLTPAELDAPYRKCFACFLSLTFYSFVLFFVLSLFSASFVSI